jgi:hypothetical protein
MAMTSGTVHWYARAHSAAGSGRHAYFRQPTRSSPPRFGVKSLEGALRGRGEIHSPRTIPAMTGTTLALDLLRRFLAALDDAR